MKINKKIGERFNAILKELRLTANGYA